MKEIASKLHGRILDWNRPYLTAEKLHEKPQTRSQKAAWDVSLFSDAIDLNLVP
jgi:hypothetical protein